MTETITQQMIDAGLNASPMWLSQLDPSTGVRYAIPPSAHVRQRAGLSSDDVAEIYLAMRAASTTEEISPSALLAERMRTIGQCAEVARSTGRRWAEETPHPRTSIMVGDHAATSILGTDVDGALSDRDTIEAMIAVLRSHCEDLGLPLKAELFETDPAF